MTLRDIEINGTKIFTAVEPDDDNQEKFAVHDGKFIKGRANAIRAAKNLLKSNPAMQSNLSKLVKKTVNRLNGACSDTSVMGA